MGEAYLMIEIIIEFVNMSLVLKLEYLNFSLGTISKKKNGKNSDIMQKGGRGLHPNHYLRTLRNNDKSSMRGGLKVIVIFFKFIHSFFGPDIPCALFP